MKIRGSIFFSADVDECAEGLSDCSQMCTNTEGGYGCSCHPGYTLNSDSSTCGLNGTLPRHSFMNYIIIQPLFCEVILSLPLADGGSVCSEGVYVDMAGDHRCVCPLGEVCTGDCTSSDLAVIQFGNQTCEGLCQCY